MLTFGRLQATMYAYHPKLKDLYSIDKNDIKDINKKAGRLFESLILKRCSEEASKAYKLEGQKALLKAFNVLGRVAGRSIAQHPKIKENFGKNIQNHIDSQYILKELKD